MHLAASTLRLSARSPRWLRHGTYERLQPHSSSTNQQTQLKHSHSIDFDGLLSPQELHLKVLADQFPKGDFENWDTCQQLLPCAIDVYNTDFKTRSSLEAWSDVTTNLSWYICKRYSIYVAYTMIVRAVAIRKRLLGIHHEKTLASISILAAILATQGRHKEAISANWSAFKGYQRLVGWRHPLTLTSMSNLALALHCRGNDTTSEILCGASELLCRITLGMTKRVLGPNHPDTLTSLNNLALLVRQRGDYCRAINLNIRAVKGLETTLGEYHPSTKTCMANLAAAIQYEPEFKDLIRVCWQSLASKTQ
jgi:hypothetical protein